MPYRRVWFVVFLVVVAALVAVAVGGDGDDPSPSSPQLASLGVEAAGDDEIAYLDGVRAAFDNLHGRQAAFRETLNQRHTTTAAFFEALEQSGASAAFAPVLDEVRDLEPPERYVSAHRRLVQYLEDSVQLDRAIAAAVVERDVAAFMVANPRIGEAEIKIYLDVPAGLCNVVARGEDRSFCSGGTAPHGAYGASLVEILERAAATVFPRTAGPIGLLTPSAQFAAFKVLQTEIIAALEAAGEAADALDPPDDLRSDHERLLRFIGDLGEIVHDAYGATEEQDLRRYFDEADRFERAICDGGGQFSAEFQPLVSVLFERPISGGAVAGPCGA